MLYSYRFYIYQKFMFIIVKDRSAYICKNILYSMKFVFIRKLYLL